MDQLSETSFILNIFAGIPATTALSGTSGVTTAFATIVTLLPFLIPPNTIVSFAIYTLPITGKTGHLESPPDYNLLSYSAFTPNITL